MVNPIPKKINNLWEDWNIRGVILFSLFLQIFLVTCSPLRKRMNNVLLLFSIWSAYLMADYAANYCVGLIASNQDATSKTIISTHSDLLSFWAPFLLVHLDGPDTITAFSLEDNALWLRHMLGFIIQFIFCVYVFLLTVPGNRLWIPTVLVFVAGMIKYGERAFALFISSKWPMSVSQNLVMPEVGGDIDAKLMLSQVEVVLVAYRFCFDKFKIVMEYYSMPFKPAKRGNYFFHQITAQDALRVIKVELNFHYEACFTKFLGFHLTALNLFRFVAMSCIFVAFGLFFSEDKHKQGYDVFDVKVTYALLFGAMALETISLLMLLFSDGAVFYFHRYRRVGFFNNILKSFQEFKRPKWSKCKKKPYTKFIELSTSVPFRRWNGSISGFNMITYSRSKKKFFVLNHYEHPYSPIFLWLHQVKNPFLLELWEFIFSELKRKSVEAANIEICERICNSRGEWILKNNSIIEEERREKLMPYVDANKIAFADSLVVWHIATHLCYVQELDDDQVDERDFSKLLSDYMMSLLVSKSKYIASAAADSVNGQEKFQLTLKMVVRFFNIDNEKDEVVACKKLVAQFSDTDNLLSDACSLVEELGMISQELGTKWKIISQVWVELLSFAAFNCGISIHLQHISKGGELISLVWLLMIRLGLRRAENLN